MSDSFPDIGRQYRIDRRLARGGMSEVFLATQVSDNRQVIIRRITQTDEALQALVLREHRLLSGLHHPAVVRVFDMFVEGGHLYIVQEYIDGTPLDLSDARSLRDLLRLFGKIAAALEYLEDHKVVHRDVKPGNILIDPHGNPHLIDFGLAVLSGETDSLTGQSIVGTPTYMAPEMITNSQDVSYRSDVYALGVMLYTALVGRAPWDEGSLQQQLYGKMRELSSGAVKALNQFRAIGLAELVSDMLRINPADRPSPQTVSKVLDDAGESLRSDPALHLLATMRVPQPGPVASRPQPAAEKITLAVAGPAAAPAAQARPVVAYLKPTNTPLPNSARKQPSLTWLLLASLLAAALMGWLFISGFGQESSYHSAVFSIGLFISGATLSVVALRQWPTSADAAIQKRIAAIEAQVARSEELTATIVAGIQQLPNEQRLREIVSASIVVALGQPQSSRDVAQVLERVGKALRSDDKSNLKRIGTFFGTIGGAVTAIIGIVSLLGATGLWSATKPPVLTGIDAVPSRVARNSRVVLNVTASDPEGLPLTYAYEATAGQIEAHGPSAVWTSTQELTAKMVEFIVTVSNGRRTVKKQHSLLVNTPPGGELQAVSTPTGTLIVRALASDVDNDPLSYEWSSTCGQFDSTTARETKLHNRTACTAEITCYIRDGFETTTLKTTAQLAAQR